MLSREARRTWSHLENLMRPPVYTSVQIDANKAPGHPRAGQTGSIVMPDDIRDQIGDDASGVKWSDGAVTIEVTANLRVLG